MEIPQSEASRLRELAHQVMDASKLPRGSKLNKRIEQALQQAYQLGRGEAIREAANAPLQAFSHGGLGNNCEHHKIRKKFLSLLARSNQMIPKDFIKKVEVFDLKEGDFLLIKIAKGTSDKALTDIADFFGARKCFSCFYETEIESLKIVRKAEEMELKNLKYNNSIPQNPERKSETK